MPKKFATQNPKAVAACERKKAAKDVTNKQEEKEREDAKWTDKDKQTVKKQQKKEADERKRQEQVQRKSEAKTLLEKEVGSIKGNIKSPKPIKVSKASIDLKKEVPQAKKKVKSTKPTHLDDLLVKNPNRLKSDRVEARTVDEAIEILAGPSGKCDKHPERRMKAAYTAFEAKKLKELKLKNPTLKLSQLKQMIFKEWQKSPENPLNKVQSDV